MRGAFAPHFGHFAISGAFTFSIFSKRWPHLSHLYSYRGNANSSQFTQSMQSVRYLKKFYHAHGWGARWQFVRVWIPGLALGAIGVGRTFVAVAAAVVALTLVPRIFFMTPGVLALLQLKITL
jgi:hypothetical protein